MENVIVAKFGGSSLADSAQFKKVKKIVEANESRRIIVPSAPGKTQKEDHKITDILYMCYQLASNKLSIDEVYKIVEVRFLKIVDELKIDLNLQEILDTIKENIQKGASKDYAASRGEFLNAIILARFLGFDFIDSASIIIFDAHGKFDSKTTDKKISEAINDETKAVIPGFYGATLDGEIVTFSRGGSDITGAIIADSLHAHLYENWTDVSGFLMADPRIVDTPKPIEVITYKELRELSYMGAPVLHEESLFPIKNKSIAINIKNTNFPEHEGTKIVDDTYPISQSATITGIAGKKDFTVIAIDKLQMITEKDFFRKLVTVFETNGIAIEHMPSSIDSVSVVVSSAQVSGKLDKLIEEIKIYCAPDHIVAYPNMALIAVVGRGIIRKKGISAKIFTALSTNDINIRMIIQGSSELNVIVGVENADFEGAIASIYKAFEED